MTSNKKAEKFISIAFISISAAALFVALVTYFVFGQHDASESEDLTLFPTVNISDYLDGGFQDTLEKSLEDQFVIRNSTVAITKSINAELGRSYNTVSNTLRGLKASSGLIPFGSVYSMNGSAWLTDMPYIEDVKSVQGYEKKASEINNFAKEHPKAKVYVYYCTRAEDMNWFDNSDGIRSFDYRSFLKSLLDSNISFGSLKFMDFEDYCNKMYKTDHHWNNIGARQGYADLLLMLGKDFPVGQARSVLYTENYGNLLWAGSRARESGVEIPENNMDIFAVDKYLLSKHSIWLGDKEQSIGLADQYASGAVERTIGFDQYLNYFGFENEPIRLEYNSSPTGANLLIVGDSFTRALREPLASHFNTTVYVNFRILGDVDLDNIMNKYDINAVIFMGQMDAWSGYFLEDTGTD